MSALAKKALLVLLTISFVICFRVLWITMAAALTREPEGPTIISSPDTTPAPTLTPTDWQTAPPEPIEETTQPPDLLPCFELTAAERDLVERVVMAESGGEPFDGMKAVAQCILTACEKDGTQPSEAVRAYKYTTARPDPSQSVREAVAAVFDDGQTVTDEPIIFFYAPALVRSEWHESQIFVVEIGGHRFFKERPQ